MKISCPLTLNTISCSTTPKVGTNICVLATVFSKLKHFRLVDEPEPESDKITRNWATQMILNL